MPPARASSRVAEPNVCVNGWSTPGLCPCSTCWVMSGAVRLAVAPQQTCCLFHPTLRLSVLADPDRALRERL